MRILLANDDGIDAYGLRELARELIRAGHSVAVTAPAAQRSAYSHAITTGDDGIDYTRVDFDGVEAYRIFGTPADCVKFGCLYLGIKPDMVIAGVNHGHNLGSEIMCSGTVAAASEGAYLGIPSVAVSAQDDPEILTLCVRYVVEHFDGIASIKMPPFTILNINYPSHPAVGYVFTHMGVRLFNDQYVKTDDKYYLRGNKIGYEDNPEDCDINWIIKNYVTITPLKADRTDAEVLEKLSLGRSQL